jgi:hypothetical protein
LASVGYNPRSHYKGGSGELQPPYHYRTFEFHKMLGISGLVEDLLAAQE